MSVRLLNLPDDIKVLPHTFGFMEDFFREDTTLWTDTEADSGASAAVVADGVGGILRLTTGATDNNEAYRATRELFKFAAHKPIQATARLKFAEANTDDANVMVGFMDAVAANAIVDNGGGPKATSSCAVIYKLDGANRWRARLGVGASFVDKELDVVAGGGNWETVRIEVRTTPDGSTLQAFFWFDRSGGNALLQSREYGAAPQLPSLMLELAIGTPTEMAFFVGAKAGGANSEVVDFDYVAPFQCR